MSYLLVLQMSLNKHISNDVKQLIVEAMEAGESSRTVANRFKMHFTNVCKLYKKWKEDGCVNHRKEAGRPPKLTERMRRTLVRNVKIDPRKNSTDIRKTALENYRVNLSKSTAQRLLR